DLGNASLYTGGDGLDGGVRQDVSVRREQRDALVEKPVTPTDLPYFQVPSHHRITAVLHHHGFRVRLFAELRELFGRDIADADDPGFLGAVNLLDCRPD